METHLADWIKGSAAGDEAESILRACVHCGFCNATCPTYQLLGDELDGPRGRIYQIKQMLEDQAPSQSTQLHLDRCLTCLNCETTCPSGVRYGRLVEIGREVLEQQVPRTPAQRGKRGMLRRFVTTRWLFGPVVRLGRLLRPLLPQGLRSKVPPLREPGARPARTHARKVLLLNSCVQPALMPAIDAATSRVLDAIGIEAIIEPRSGCCGAIDYHLTALDAARNAARRNIDAWWPHLERGVEAIVINASGCGAQVKDYAHVLADDPAYAEKAVRVAASTRDLAEFLAPHSTTLASLAQGHRSMQPSTLSPQPSPLRIAFHPPCTLQHTQKIRGVVEGILTALGADLLPVTDAHLCCGSAGSYSLLQPELSLQLRARKLENLERAQPQMILSANIGCLSHLETGTAVPVRHWIEWVERRISSPP